MPLVHLITRRTGYTRLAGSIRGYRHAARHQARVIGQGSGQKDDANGDAIGDDRKHGPSHSPSEQQAADLKAGTRAKGANDADQAPKPSLFEQLFPEQAAPKPKPAVETIPDGGRIRKSFSLNVRPASYTPKPDSRPEPRRSVPAFRQQLEQQEAEGGPQISVLVLRNASKNLLEEDFKRLVPTGKHIEGWQLAEGNLVQVIPSRDWQTLERDGTYYLLFSSAVSASAYQAHATKVQRLVSQQTPSNILSPILPPPGYMVKGLDANRAIESFTLSAPNAPFELRQLKPPLHPVVQNIVKHRGYQHVLNRKDRLPYEVRLVLDGPQYHTSSIRQIFLLSGKDRALSWSGSDWHPMPRITEWEPSRHPQAPSITAVGHEALRQAEKWSHQVDRLGSDGRSLDESDGDQGVFKEKRRTLQKVYIIGFHTENAMQSFVHFWHRRPMEWKGYEPFVVDGEEQDLTPIAHVEVLW